MKKILFFGIFIFSFYFSFFTLKTYAATCAQFGYNNSNCSSCSCDSVDPRSAHPGCYGSNFGTITCYGRQQPNPLPYPSVQGSCSGSDYLYVCYHKDVEDGHIVRLSLMYQDLEVIMKMFLTGIVGLLAGLVVSIYVHHQASLSRLPAK